MPVRMDAACIALRQWFVCGLHELTELTENIPSGTPNYRDTVHCQFGGCVNFVHRPIIMHFMDFSYLTSLHSQA